MRTVEGLRDFWNAGWQQTSSLLPPSVPKRLQLFYEPNAFYMVEFKHNWMITVAVMRLHVGHVQYFTLVNFDCIIHVFFSGMIRCS